MATAEATRYNEQEWGLASHNLPDAGKAVEMTPFITPAPTPPCLGAVSFLPFTDHHMRELSKLSTTWLGAGPRVTVQYEHWNIEIGSRWFQHGQSGHWVTRVRVPFVTADSLQLFMGRRVVFWSELHRLFGGQQLESGVGDIDKSWVLQSNHVEKFMRLFHQGNEKIGREETAICHHLRKVQERSMWLRTQTDDGWFGAKFQEDENMLRIETRHVRVGDVGELIDMMELAAVLLKELVRIGSAKPTPATVTL